MSIYTELKDAGVPIESHFSDLYVKVTNESQEIVGVHRGPGVAIAVFHSPLDNELWFEIPFAFDPYWEGKS